MLTQATGIGIGLSPNLLSDVEPSIVPVEQYMVTQDGDYLVTQDGDYIVSQQTISIVGFSTQDGDTIITQDGDEFTIQ